MDPNANLREQRELAAKFSRQDQACATYSLHDLSRLADLAEAMDEWLSGGGFLPDAWRRTGTADH